MNDPVRLSRNMNKESRVRMFMRLPFCCAGVADFAEVCRNFPNWRLYLVEVGRSYSDS